MAFGIGEIDLINTVLVALLEDGGIVGLGHDHGDFILIGDGDGGLGDVAAKGSEQEMDFIHRHQALVELRRFGRLTLIIVDDKFDWQLFIVCLDVDPSVLSQSCFFESLGVCKSLNS